MASSTLSYTDLLIIGAGPAGMMAAAWASQYNISTRIIDKNDARTPTGHADGLQARTLEILDSFGGADGLWEKGFHELEVCIWNPDENGGIRRSQRVLSQKRDLSRFSQAIINQGAVEQNFIDLLKINGRVQVERCVVTEQLIFDQSNKDAENAYPVTVEIRASQPGKKISDMKGHCQSDSEGTGNDSRAMNGIDHGSIEIVKAKYVIGCDGAHSWTRRKLGLSLEGKQSDHIWGVMDIIPLTDFPDVRQSCAIHSATCGSLMLVPREDRLNRFYIQLSQEGQTYDRTKVTPKTMLRIAQGIMKPYKIDYRYCDWWSLYQIGQRVAPEFSVDNRIFLAGDAVHTHSPKLGQGMNVSMQDTYNLGWKLGAVLSGRAQRAILQTYHSERRQVALDLLAADELFSRYYTRDSAKGSTLNKADQMDASDFAAIREELHGFLSGVGVSYGPSVLVAKSNDGVPVDTNDNELEDIIAKQDLAANIKLGARIPSFKVLNQACATPVHLAKMLKSDGRWRLLVFAGDLKDIAQARRVKELGAALATPNSFLRKYSGSDQAVDPAIEVLTIHSSPRIEVELFDLDDIFHPYDENLGWDYWKVFVDDVSHHEGFDDAYYKYGIDKREGCVVVCRPDQHVGYIGALEDVGDMERYFSRILVPHKSFL